MSLLENEVEFRQAPATSEETRAVLLARDLTEEQKKALLAQNQLARREFDLARPAFERLAEYQRARGELLPLSEQKRILQSELDAQAQLDLLRDEVLAIERDILESGSSATPAQIAAIQRAGDAAERHGHSNLRRTTDETLALIADKLRSDEPFDRGDAVGREFQRQVGQLKSTIGQTSAEQQLVLPLKEAPLRSALASTALGVGQRGVTFDEARRSQGQENARTILGLAESALAGAGQVAGAGAAGQSNIAGQLARRRAGAGTRETTPSILGLAGGAISGGVGNLLKRWP